MEKKLMLIINPAAGRGGYQNNLGEALQTLDAHRFHPWEGTRRNMIRLPAWAATERSAK